MGKLRRAVVLEVLLERMRGGLPAYPVARGNFK